MKTERQGTAWQTGWAALPLQWDEYVLNWADVLSLQCSDMLHVHTLKS